MKQQEHGAKEPISIKNAYEIGRYYMIKKERWECIGKYEFFGRFRKADGSIESFLWWDLEYWKMHPDKEMGDMRAKK